MSDEFPPAPSAREAAEVRRRQRGKNWGLLAALVLLIVLFYAVTVVRMGAH